MRWPPEAWNNQTPLLHLRTFQINYVIGPTAVRSLAPADRPYLAIVFLMVCSGCARTSIDSNKQPGYSFAEDRLLVVEHSTNDAIQQGLQSSLPILMRSCGVETINEVVPENLGDTQEARDNITRSIHEHVRQHNLKTVLEIFRDSTLVRTVYGTPAGALSYKYQATLKDAQDNKLWTSIISLKPNDLISGGIYGTNTEDMGQMLAHDLVEKMQEDGVLLKCPAN